MDIFFSKFQCGFRKSYCTQQCLLALIENLTSHLVRFWLISWRLLIFLPHESLIAKLYSYGFSLNALRLTHSYLSNRRQRTKINKNFGSCEEILFGVHQRSTLGPLLFNIFMCDLFFIVKEIDFASYADDNIPFVSGDRLDDVLDSLENAGLKLFDWFYDNQTKANPG